MHHSPRLLEVCVLCGFVHRDDRPEPRVRQSKLHYHWEVYDSFALPMGDDHWPAALRPLAAAVRIEAKLGVRVVPTACHHCLAQVCIAAVSGAEILDLWTKARLETEPRHKAGAARYNATWRGPTSLLDPLYAAVLRAVEGGAL